MSPIPLVLPRQARLAMIAYCATLLVTIIWSVASSITAGGLQIEFDRKTEMLRALRAQLLPGVEQSASANRRAMPSAVISAPTETVAASLLQKEILAALQTSGGYVHSIQASASSEVTADALRRLNAQLTFDSSIDSLQLLLFKLETGVPFIFIDTLAAQPTSATQPGARPGDTLRDRKSTRLNSSHIQKSRMPSSA